MEQTDLLLTGGHVVTMNPIREVLDEGAVAIRDDRIVAVGTTTTLRAQFAAARELDCGGKLVLPGFIDAHNHPVHFLSQGFSDDVPLYWRASNRIRPMERHLRPDEAYAASLGNFASMLLQGTTCFLDPGGPYPDAVGQAAENIGIRGLIARSAQDIGSEALLIEEASGALDRVLEESVSLYDRWNGRGNGRVGVSFSLRDAQSTSDELCRRMQEVAVERDAVVQMHLMTNPEFEARMISQWGVNGMKRLERLGLLGPHLSLVHMGAVDDDEVRMLAESGTGVVHCPSASLLGGMGAVSSGGFLKMFEAGVLVALGTDAAAVSRFLDMIRVMYLAATTHKDVANDPVVAGCYRALEMATIDGARALRIDDRVGSLEAGKLADLVVIDMDGPAWQPDPFFNPIANLVYAADSSSVRHVVVNGALVVEDRVLTTVDAHDSWRAARVSRGELMARADIQLASPWPVM